jgi:hypothetical protein
MRGRADLLPQFGDFALESEYVGVSNLFLDLKDEPSPSFVAAPNILILHSLRPTNVRAIRDSSSQSIQCVARFNCFGNNCSHHAPRDDFQVILSRFCDRVTNDLPRPCWHNRSIVLRGALEEVFWA